MKCTRNNEFTIQNSEKLVNNYVSLIKSIEKYYLWFIFRCIKLTGEFCYHHFFPAKLNVRGDIFESLLILTCSISNAWLHYNRTFYVSDVHY